MTTNEPEIRHGNIRRPNTGGIAAWRAAEQAALQEAQTAVADGERVVDLRIEGGRSERGNDSVMVYSYSYQVVKPGTTGWSTRLR
jgi:hypothetical protein